MWCEPVGVKPKVLLYPFLFCPSTIFSFPSYITFTTLHILLSIENKKKKNSVFLWLVLPNHILDLKFYLLIGSIPKARAEVPSFIEILPLQIWEIIIVGLTGLESIQQLILFWSQIIFISPVILVLHHCGPSFHPRGLWWQCHISSSLFFWFPNPQITDNFISFGMYLVSISYHKFLLVDFTTAIWGGILY